MSKHSKSFAEEGRSAVEVAGVSNRTNAGKRSNLLLPALYRKTHTKTQVYISFRNILNNVYNDRNLNHNELRRKKNI